MMTRVLLARLCVSNRKRSQNRIKRRSFRKDWSWKLCSGYLNFDVQLCKICNKAKHPGADYVLKFMDMDIRIRSGRIIFVRDL